MIGMGEGVRCRAGGARFTREGVRAATAAALGAVILACAGGAGGQALGGSAVSLDRQNAQARAHDFTYLHAPGDVRRFVDAGYLVLVVPNQDFELHDVSYPYARPEARLFIERLASQYRSACGEKLVVTSLTRPLSDQPSNASDRSVHPTGMAIDFRRSNRSVCRSWLESTTLTLEGRGVLEVTRERRPPHYHVVIYPRQYRSYVARITGGTVTFAATSGAEPALDEEWVTHVVRRGDSLSRIASDYGVSLSRIRAENGLRGDRILVGQRLRLPVLRPAPAQASVVSRMPAPEPLPVASEAVAAAEPALDEEWATHVVRRGDSLSRIASDYGVSLSRIRAENGLRGDRILVGQRLRLPVLRPAPAQASVVSRMPAPEPPPVASEAVVAAEPALDEEWVTHVVRRGDSLSRIASDYGVSLSRIRAENGLRGDRILVGQRLRLLVLRPVPAQASVASRVVAPEPPPVASEAVAGALPEEAPGQASEEGEGTHRVRSGESLWTIARDYGIDDVSLRRANAITGSRIFPGQELSIPSGSGGGSRASFEHTVRSGESLWTIARAYRTSDEAIRVANGLSGSRLLAGQRLTIPGAGGGGTIMAHIVRPGESLWTIANRHGTTVDDLRRTNGIRSSRIYPGQTLNVLLGG